MNTTLYKISQIQTYKEPMQMHSQDILDDMWKSTKFVTFKHYNLHVLFVI